VVQPHLPGAAASLSLLCRDGRARLLSCNRQAVRREGGWLRYRGGVVGGAEERRAAYEPLAAGVAAALPGLWGHVGVDLVDDGERPVVIEVNPRLCLPYAGLRSRLGTNPAGLVLALLDGDG
jgi:tyramine---L-glutamate ligase